MPEINPIPDPTRVAEKASKPRFDLIAPHFLLGLARGLTTGAKKHGERTYLKYPRKHYVAALHRHINAYQQGESIDTDEVTGDVNTHLALAGCCIMILSEMDRLGIDTEDDNG